MRQPMSIGQTKGMTVELVIHTTCGIEFEILEQATGKVIRERSYVCDEDDEDAEDAAKDRVLRFCERNGFNLVGEVWS